MCIRDRYKTIKEIEERIDYVFKTATNDEGMTGSETVSFHSHNKSGLLNKLNKIGWKAYDECGLIAGAFANSYYGDALLKLAEQKKPRWNRINVLIEMMTEAIERWEEKIEIHKTHN